MLLKERPYTISYFLSVVGEMAEVVVSHDHCRQMPHPLLLHHVPPSRVRVGKLEGHPAPPLRSHHLPRYPTQYNSIGKGHEIPPLQSNLDTVNVLVNIVNSGAILLSYIVYTICEAQV